MTELQNTILDAALPHVAFDGWTMGVLERAAEAAGLTAFDARRAFPGGALEAVEYFSTRADAAMVAELRARYSLATMKIRERIATAVMVRLRQQTHQREAVRRAHAISSLPWNKMAEMKAVYATVDAMWREAGDTATDYNFYTKRLLLAKVYLTTVRVWFDDTSPDLADTEGFLRRRIENVMQIEKLKAKAKDALGNMESWLPKFR
jgi:ubiquinone biosynthesis protein COQ9